MGPLGEPIAELKKLGWFILLPGKGNASTNILFTKASLHDYETYVVYTVWTLKRNTRKITSLFTGNLENS